MPPLTEAEHDAMLARYTELQDRFRVSDGYQIELKVATVLRGLGFEPDAQQQLTDHLSGGWQMRLALAKLLLSEPDLLLLDEPTNHLDLDARNWLEEFLVAYPHSVILVSHDRYFLDAVVTRIADLSLPRSPTTTATTRSISSSATRASSGSATPSGARTRRSSASRSSSTASATRPPRRRRCRAASRCSRRSSASTCRPSASASTFSSPPRRRAAAWCSS